MAYKQAEIKAKLQTIRDAILDDLASDSGPKFRIASYSAAGRSFSYSTREGALKAFKEVEALIEVYSDSGSTMFQLGRVSPTSG